jgi:nitrogen fixation NifU-like protein
MDDFYREQIIDRYQNPLFKGELDPNDLSFEDDNPLCGDRIRIDMRIDGSGIVYEATFDGEGCAISQASADLLLEEVMGKSIDDLKAITKNDVLDLLGIDLGPVRMKCALLSLKVLKAGVYGLGGTRDDSVG